MGKRKKKRKQHIENKYSEPELQENITEDTPESENEPEEELVDPIEIPDVFPEELSEDLETDIPDAPEPKPEKKNIFAKIAQFFKESILEEEIDKNEPEALLENISENESEALEQNIPENEPDALPETIPENELEILPEHIPEHEIQEFIDDVPEEKPEKNNEQILFSEFNENEFPTAASDSELPDLRYMDDVAELPNPMELDEPEEKEDDEFADAPETMPDGVLVDFESGNMILTPEENDFPDKEITSSAPVSETTTEKPQRHILGKLVAVLFAVILIAVIVICFQNGIFNEKEVYHMPDLVGKNYYDLQEDTLQLDIQIDKSEYSAYEKDMIYEQDIPAGEEIKLGQTVHVNISLGFDMEIVPDVRNYQSAYAQKMLEQAGFRTEIQYEMSRGGTQNGNVIRTEPAIGEEIVIGTVVTMYVSQGSNNTSATVPDVVGMTLDEAIALCEESGLTVDAVAVPSLEAENTIVSQNLEVNSQVDFGTVIVLNYSNAEEPDGTVYYQMELPAYANGRFILDFIDQQGTVIATSTLVAGFSAGSAIPVEGYGTQQIKVVLNNDATTQQAEIGIYDFDFTTGTYTVITEDIQSAFETVNGIG